MPKIAIVILNWNQAKLTISTIESMLQMKHINFNYQIVLVDNGSSDNSINQFNLQYGNNTNIKIIQSRINQGYSGGNNLGINWAIKNKFDYILIANNDIRVDQNFLEELLSEINKCPKSILAPKIYFEKGYEFHKNRYKKSELGKVLWALGGRIDWDNIYGSNIAIDEVDHGQYDKTAILPNFISGCCFLTPTTLFKEIGLFDKKYFLYLEDADLSVRATQAGYQLKVIPKSKIWHINSGTAGAASKLQDYFISRNRLLFANKYASIRTKIALFRESIKFLLIGRYWQKRGVVDFYLSNFKQGSWK